MADTNKRRTAATDDEFRGLPPPITDQQRGIALTPARNSLTSGRATPSAAQAPVSRPQGSCPAPLDDSEVLVPAWAPDPEERLARNELADANEIHISLNSNIPPKNKPAGQRRSEYLNINFQAADYANAYGWWYEEFIVADARGIRDGTVLLRHVAEVNDPMFSSAAASFKTRSADPAIAVRRAVQRMQLLTDLSHICPNLKVALTKGEQQAIGAVLNMLLRTVRTWQTPAGSTKMPVVAQEETIGLMLNVPPECRNAMRKRFGAGLLTIPLRSSRVHFQLNEPKQSNASPDPSVLVDPRELETLRQTLRDALFLAAVPLRVRIYGYADRIGEQASNQALSQRRAEWLKRQIQADPTLGSVGDIAVQGCGEDMAPLSPEASPAYRIGVVRPEHAGSSGATKR